MASIEGRSETVVVAAEDAGERLDRVLAARIAELSRSRHKALILAGHVAIDGAHDPRSGPPRQRRRHHRARSAAAAGPPRPQPESIPLNVVYEDDDIIVIDKPHGLVVHPAAGNWTGTLVNALIAHCGDSLSGIGGVRRPGIVHRLDKDTTGLMVVAKTDRAHHALAAQFADHGRTGPLRRGYLAFVWGVPDRPQGHDRQADRPPSARARQDGGARRAAARPSPTGRCWSATSAATARRSRACSPAGWRPGAPTRSGSIWPLSAIRCSAMTVYGPGFKTKASHLGAGGASRAGGPWKTGPACLSTGHRTPGRGARSLEFRSELPADLASFTPQPGCRRHTRLDGEKPQPINGLARTRRRHGDVTPSCLSFAGT